MGRPPSACAHTSRPSDEDTQALPPLAHTLKRTGRGLKSSRTATVVPGARAVAAAPVSLPAWSYVRRTPAAPCAVRVTTLTSASAHSELSASPRNPNVLSSCGKPSASVSALRVGSAADRQVGGCLQVVEAAELGRVVLERERFIIFWLNATPVVGHLYELAAMFFEPHLLTPLRQLQASEVPDTQLEC